MLPPAWMTVTSKDQPAHTSGNSYKPRYLHPTWSVVPSSTVLSAYASKWGTHRGQRVHPATAALRPQVPSAAYPSPGEGVPAVRGCQRSPPSLGRPPDRSTSRVVRDVQQQLGLVILNTGAKHYRPPQAPGHQHGYQPQRGHGELPVCLDATNRTPGGRTTCPYCCPPFRGKAPGSRSTAWCIGGSTGSCSSRTRVAGTSCNWWLTAQGRELSSRRPCRGSLSHTSSTWP
ncbi:hypothetical protein MTO96_029860 [Rhipicephalus appendiculatus]